jgi:Flp pilus assembly protein TadB
MDMVSQPFVLGRRLARASPSRIFLAFFSEALGIAARSLRAGHPLGSAFQLIFASIVKSLAKVA